MGKRKLFAVDIDGTLCVPGHEIAPQVIESLRRCVGSDVSVVFSTGKKFVSIHSLCEDVGIDGPVITCNGAMVIGSSCPKGIVLTFLTRDCVQKDNFRSPK